MYPIVLLVKQDPPINSRNKIKLPSNLTSNFSFQIFSVLENIIVLKMNWVDTMTEQVVM